MSALVEPLLLAVLWTATISADDQVSCRAIEAERLARTAKTVLDNNWNGHWTMPAQSGYPHLRSLDSAFLAMSYSHYNQQHAMMELRTLFAAQWRNGLLPHVVFNPSYIADYFPGPSLWLTNTSDNSPKSLTTQTSGIVHPPVHATAVLTIYRHATNVTVAQEFLHEMLPKLVAWHDYLAMERDVDGDGLVYIRHPWESGMDNSPVWDGPLAEIVLKPGMIPPYKRTDNTRVNAAQRPTQFMYDRYVYLITLFSRNSYNETAIREVCPFLVQDVSFNSIWARANFDLARLANLSNLPNAKDIAQMALVRAKTTVASMKTKLWTDGFFFSKDLSNPSKSLLKHKSSGGFLPFWSVTYPSTKTETVTIEQVFDLFSQLYSENFLMPPINKSEAFDPLTGWRGFGLPSVSRNDVNFSLVNYWRGPAWITVHFLIGHGLEHLSKDKDLPSSLRGMLASAHDGIRRLSYHLVQESGFFEYFNVDNGHGLGAVNFSSSAALILLQLHIDCPSEVQRAISSRPPTLTTKTINWALLSSLLAVFLCLLAGTFICWHIEEKQERKRHGQMG